MKNIFKLAAIAAVATSMLVACNLKKNAEEEIDSTAIEQVAEEVIVAEQPAEVLDTVATEVQQDVVATAKKAVKKAQPVAQPTTSTDVKEAGTTTTVQENQPLPAAPQGEVKKVSSVKRGSARR